MCVGGGAFVYVGLGVCLRGCMFWDSVGVCGVCWAGVFVWRWCVCMWCGFVFGVMCV